MMLIFFAVINGLLSGFIFHRDLLDGIKLCLHNRFLQLIDFALLGVDLRKQRASSP